MTTIADDRPVVTEKIEIEHTPFCCHLDETSGGQTSVCHRITFLSSLGSGSVDRTIYEVTFGPDADDYTYSCTHHLGRMMLVRDDADEAEQVWSVRVVVDRDGTVLED